MHHTKLQINVLQLTLGDIRVVDNCLIGFSPPSIDFQEEHLEQNINISLNI